MGFSKTTWNAGAAPGISATEMNRIEDGIEAASPTGGLMMFGGSSAPTGWLLCDGSAVSRTTYSDLFAVIGTAYGSGDGSTTFNVPDMRQAFPLGKAASGTGAALGDTGGTIDATVDLAHTHDIGHGHSDTIATASGGSHTHTMGNHNHTYSIDHNHGAVTSATDTVGSETGDAGRSGLFSKNDIYVASDSTSHRHGDGSLSYSGGPVSGYTSYASASHYHGPTSTAHVHTHSVDLPSFTAVTQTTSSTDPGDTASGGSHTHSVTGGVTSHSGNSGSALSASESIPNPPFVTVNFIIRT